MDETEEKQEKQEEKQIKLIKNSSCKLPCHMPLLLNTSSNQNAQSHLFMHPTT